MQTQTDNQLNSDKFHAWMVFLGQQMPIPDTRRIDFNEKFEIRMRKENGQKERKITYPRSFEDTVNLFFTAKESKKFRRGITRMVLNGEYNNSRIYDVLRKRGFANKPNSKDCYGKTTFLQYIKYVRIRYKRPMLQKKERISVLLKQRIPRNRIKDELNTSDEYIAEVAKEYNLKVTKSEIKETDKRLKFGRSRSK